MSSLFRCSYLGSWFCVGLFRELNVGVVLEALPVSMLWLHSTDEAGGIFSGFSVTVMKIRSSVSSRVEGGSWLKDLSDNRQRHWLRSLMRQVTAQLGLGWRNRLLEGFDALVAQGRVPVSRSFKT